jgi:hypothetical protein
MTKRDYITIFLEKVKEIWEPARGFLVLMRYNILNEEQTEDLFQVFKSVVQSSSDEMKKRKLQRAILAVENLRNQEKTETTLNQDLDQILAEI